MTHTLESDPDGIYLLLLGVVFYSLNFMVSVSGIEVIRGILANRSIATGIRNM